MGALETFRRGDLREGDPLDWHPVNQAMAKDLRNRRGKGEESPKVKRAAKRKRRQEKFVQGHIADAANRTMKPYQLREYRKGLPPRDSFRRLFNGFAIADDIVDIMEHEHVIDTFYFEKGTKATIIFVEIPPRTGIKKSK